MQVVGRSGKVQAKMPIGQVTQNNHYAFVRTAG